MSKTALIKENVKLLTKKEPDVKDNYNLLVMRYWQKYEGANQIEDILYCTPAESITRAFRSLVKTGDIVLKKEIRTIRRKQRSEFEKEYRKVM